MSLDLIELSTEWMMEKAEGAQHARDWLMALNVRYGVAASILPPAPHHADEVEAVRTKVLEMSSLNGRLSAVAVEAVADGSICGDDSAAIMIECDKIIEKAQRLKRNVVRAAQDKARAAC